MEADTAGLRQDLECLTDAVRKELESLHEGMEMLHTQIQQGGGGVAPGSDMVQLVQALDEEAGKRYESDELLKQEMAEMANRVEQLWHGVEAISAESQTHKAELQVVREHTAGGGEGGRDVMNTSAPGGAPIQIPEGTEAGDYALQLIGVVQEEFRSTIQQERNDVNALRLDFSEAIQIEKDERLQHETQLRAELVEVIANERNERVNEHMEHRNETVRMFDEWHHCLQAHGVVLEESADKDGQRSHVDTENPGNSGFMSRLFRKNKTPQSGES